MLNKVVLLARQHCSETEDRIRPAPDPFRNRQPQGGAVIRSLGLCGHGTEGRMGWHTITEEIFMHRQSLQRRKIPIPPVLTDAEWESLNVPTLFLVGEHEMIYSAQKAVQRLKRTAPHVRSEIILGAGHDLTFVQAAMVNQRILKVPQAGACPVGYVWSVHSLKNESRRGHRSNIPQKGDASR
jgi:pimeloyl-ACP methyl ester carboxylesterase